MAEYEIFTKGDLEAVRKIAVFNDPKFIKCTIVGTLDNDSDDIQKRVKILYRIINLNPFILKSYHQLDILRPDYISPLLEENVHVDLLKTLLDNGADFRLSARNDRNLLAVAVGSNMNESQFYSLCSYLINKHKAYDLFSNKGNLDSILQQKSEWMCPVAFMLFSKNYVYLDTLKMIFSIPRFDINQSCSMDMKEEGMLDFTLFQIANERGKGVDVYKLMIEKGADYKRKYPNEKKTLIYAVKYADTQAFDYYVSLGFTVNEKDLFGATAVIYACWDLKMIDYLRKKGEDLSMEDHDGNSVLHFSAQEEHPDNFCKIVLYFGEHASDVLHKRNQNGETPLDIRSRKHPDDHEGIELLERAIAFHEKKNVKLLCKIA